jgi:hypothetical protein
MNIRDVSFSANKAPTSLVNLANGRRLQMRDNGVVSGQGNNEPGGSGVDDAFRGTIRTHRSSQLRAGEGGPYS